jgi:hypothetical protein
VVPGLYEGYTLAGVAFVGTDSAGVRYAASVYNPNPDILGPGLAPVMVVHDSGTGALVRVLELYINASVPLGGTLTGLARTWGDTLVVSLVVDGVGAIVAYSVPSILAQSSGARRGTAAGVLTAATATQRTTPSPSNGPLYLNLRNFVPRGGVSFYRDDFDCRLLLSEGGDGVLPRTLIIPLADCGWWFGLTISNLDNDGMTYPVLLQTSTLYLGLHVVGVQVFKDDVDLMTYAAVTRCVISLPYYCRVEFLALNVTSGGAGPAKFALASNSSLQPAEPVNTLLLPSGAVGLAWDEDSQEFIVGFAGGAMENVMAMAASNKVMEDRMFIFSKPILKTVKPGAID